jgi:hypothetical protein
MTCAGSLNPVCGMQLYVFRQDLFGSAGGVRGEFNASGFETQVNRVHRAFLSMNALLALCGAFIVREIDGADWPGREARQKQSPSTGQYPTPTKQVKSGDY